MSTTEAYEADGHSYRPMPGARCGCGGELVLRDETVLVCAECGGQSEEPTLRNGQKVTVGGIKGECRVLYLPRTTDADGDLVAAVEDELGGTHAVKRRLCRPAGARKVSSEGLDQCSLCGEWIRADRAMLHWETQCRGGRK